MDYVP
jgi:hypothetical protein